MVETKTIGYSTLSAVIATLLILGGINVATDDNVYYCEDRALVMQCDSISAYYSLENGKCWNSVEGNKLCRSGFVKVVEDIIPDEVDYTVPTQSEGTGSREVCTNDGCVEV